MSGSSLNDLEAFLKYEMLQLKLKNFTIKKASKRFKVSKEQVKESYAKVRAQNIKEALQRGFVYFLLSSIFLFVGIKSIQSSSGYLYLGGLLFGSAGILTAFGYFFLAFKGKYSQN